MNNMIVWQKVERNHILNTYVGTHSTVHAIQIFLSIYSQNTSSFLRHYLTWCSQNRELKLYPLHYKIRCHLLKMSKNFKRSWTVYDSHLMVWTYLCGRSIESNAQQGTKAKASCNCDWHQQNTSKTHSSLWLHRVMPPEQWNSCIHQLKHERMYNTNIGIMDYFILNVIPQVTLLSIQQ